MRQIHLWPEEKTTVAEVTTIKVTIEYPNQSRKSLWYSIPAAYNSLLTSSCDPFVVATLMMAMQQSSNLIIHGQVSPSLLQNLTEFQAAWVCWRSRNYQQIEISAEVEQETSNVNSEEKAIAAFSGGVDSCFTMYRHHQGLCGRWQRNLQAGLMVQGFDISLEQSQFFQAAAARSRKILSSLGVELIAIATNFREFVHDWEDAHGTGIASCLMLFQGGFNSALIPSTEPYQALIPWGSNPVTDHLLSSNTFQIIHDGAGNTRVQKVAQLCKWPEALQSLRVCWQGSQSDRNCGCCEKCIRTILNFRVVGYGLPKCFDQDISDRQILGLTNLNSLQIAELEQIYLTAKSRNISDSWVKALFKAIQKNRRQVIFNQLKSSLKSKLHP